MLIAHGKLSSKVGHTRILHALFLMLAKVMMVSLSGAAKSCRNSHFVYLVPFSVLFTRFHARLWGREASTHKAYKHFSKGVSFYFKRDARADLCR